MTDPQSPSPTSLEGVRQIDAVCDQYEADRRAGREPPIAELIEQIAPSLRAALLEELLKIERELAQRSEDIPTAIGARSSMAGATAASGAEGEPSSGRFRAMRQHAQGGLGRIWVAFDAELRREVALKEILPEQAAHRERRERFVLEAEITGRLEHPGIVPVYGLGLAADGRPFYAMRFIQGVSLEQAIRQFHREDRGDRPFTAARSFELRQLLGRFVAVCNAIDFAHSRGIVHRDLKPGNIMLGEYGETLVVDWGMAKVLRRKETDAADGAVLPPLADDPITVDAVEEQRSGAAPTRENSVFGTPQFMSPEQAAGQIARIGPASDVYSLGVTLYYLLVGQNAFGGTTAEVLAAVQANTFEAPRRRVPSLPRPLEAICLKAMSAPPDARYLSARQMADDVEHWLADEPVLACRERWPARLARFGRRHRAAVRAGVAALAVVATGALAAALFFNELRKEQTQLRRRAETGEAQALKSEAKAKAERAAAIAAGEREAQQRRAAQESARRARAATDFLVSVFDSADPLGLAGLGLQRAADGAKPNSPREILERGAARVESELGAEPLLQATLFDALGLAYLGQGELEQAEALSDRAWELRVARLDPAHPDMLASQWSRALGKLIRSETLQAESLLRQVLAGQQAAGDTPPLVIARTQFYLGMALKEQYRAPEAEAMFRAALETRMQVLGARHQETVLARLLLIDMLLGQDKQSEAVLETAKLTDAVDAELATLLSRGFVRLHEMERRRLKRDFAGALEICDLLLADTRRVLGGGHGATMLVEMQRASLLRQLGSVREGEALGRQVFERMPRTLARTPRMSEPYYKFAQALSSRGDRAGAERYFLEAYRVGGATTVRENAWGLRAGVALASVKQDRGEMAEAEALCREVLSRCAPDRPQDSIDAQSTLYSILRANGDFDEALPLVQSLYERHWSRRQETYPAAIGWAREYASFLRERGDYADAFRLEAEALAVARQILPEVRVGFGVGQLHSVAACLEAEGDLAEAEKLWRLAIEETRQLTTPGHPDRATLLLPSAESLRRIGKHDEAATLLQEIYGICREKLGDDHLTTSESQLALARTQQAQGMTAEALATAREALASRRKAWGEDDLRTHAAAAVMAEILSREQQFDEAESLVRASLVAHQTLLPATDVRVWQAHLDLIDLLLARPDPAGAATAAEAARQSLAPVFPKGSWRLAEIASRKGDALSAERQFAEAEPLLVESLAGLRNAWGPAHRSVQQAVERIVRHYERAGNETAAAAHRALLLPPAARP